MKNIGLLAAIFHLLLFTYIYFTSRSNLSIEDFTLCRAFQYSEKIGSIVLIIITTTLLLKFLKDNGYLDNNTLKCLFAIIFLIWLIFLTEHDNHRIFAFIGFVVIMLIPYVICFQNTSIYLYEMTNICSFFVIFSCVLSLCEYFSENHEYFRFLFSCMEIVIVMLYFLFLLTMSSV